MQKHHTRTKPGARSIGTRAAQRAVAVMHAEYRFDLDPIHTTDEFTCRSMEGQMKREIRSSPFSSLHLVVISIASLASFVALVALTR